MKTGQQTNISESSFCSKLIDTAAEHMIKLSMIKNIETNKQKKKEILYLKFFRIVHSRDGLHQMRGWMVAEVGADITDAQTTAAALQIFRVLKGRFVQCINL